RIPARYGRVGFGSERPGTGAGAGTFTGTGTKPPRTPPPAVIPQFPHPGGGGTWGGLPGGRAGAEGTPPPTPAVQGRGGAEGPGARKGLVFRSAPPQHP